MTAVSTACHAWLEENTDALGLKMVWLNDLYGGKFPITWSLAIISGIIGASIALSLLLEPRCRTEGSTR